MTFATVRDIMAVEEHRERDGLLAEAHDLLQRLSPEDLIEIMEEMANVL